MMLSSRILNVDFRVPICGTQTALAFFSWELSQTRKSELGNQKSEIKQPCISGRCIDLLLKEGL